MKKLLPVVALLSVPALLLFWGSGPYSEAPAPPATATNPAQNPPRVQEPQVSRVAGEFHRWARDYARASAAERPGLLEQGRTLAQSHRERMKLLISADPRRALEEALPVRLRHTLPPEIAEVIEQRVNARGRYAVRGVLGAPGDSSGIRRSFETADGKRYEARVYGRRVQQRTTDGAAAHGVALDGVIALDDDPLRIMEPGERLPEGQSVFFSCPVSKTKVAAAETITPETPAVELGGSIHFLCNGGHIHALRESAVAAEGGSGGPSKPTGAVPSSWSTGAKSVLFIRVTFPDQWTDPQPEKESYEMMKSVNDFFVENSHGALHLMTTVTPLLVMPKTAAWYSANDSGSADAVLSDARATARAAGFDYASYDLDAVRYSGASGSFNGQAYVGTRGCWLKTSSAGVTVHEIGHNFGLWHANFWNTGGESCIGSGTNAEYGNSFDTMGSAYAGDHWFNAGHQSDLGWIPAANVTRVTASGLYRLHQFDQPRIDPACRYLLSVEKDARRDYWCEFRQRWTSIPWVMNGLMLNWSPWGDGGNAYAPYGSNSGGQLLDTTPGSLDGKSDSPVVLGRTFSDQSAGVHLTPVSKGGTTPESLDVVVNLGTFPGNQPPVLSLAAGTLTAGVNEVITFTATASDPDGDALAISWDWDDRTFGPNAAVAAKSWNTAGLYTVRCEVSDMRGGTRSALLPLTVGTPTQARITGRVLTTEGTPVSGARISCVQAGTSGTNQRLCLTDSAGNYLLSGLPDADYTLTAVHESFTMTEGFPSPLTVAGADASANYTATARPAVKMTLPDSSCSEAGDGAVLRFTRTASTNAGELILRLFVGGTATLDDVSFSPAEQYDQGTYLFTLPDGAASLNVAVSAANDSTAEGPETLSFHLVDGSGYVPSGTEFVTLLVNDNDTTLPVVSIAAMDDSATENGDGAVLRLSRTGAVTAPLAIGLNRSGTATASSDYLGINTTATIPAGLASVDLSLTAVTDAAAEGTETATFSINSSASWIRSPVAASASVQVLDANIPVVTVTAVDETADEANSDLAVFVFTRSGATGNSLTVDYALGGTAQHGTDYWPLSGTVTIPAGLSNAALVMTPVDDAMGEPLQTVTVQVRNSTRYRAGTAFNANATLADNDVPHLMVTVSDGSCDESGDPGRFRIQSYGTGTDSVTIFYTMSGTAAAGTDYAPVSGSISVPRSGYAEVQVTPQQDAEFEDTESVVLTLQPDPAYTLAPENKAAFTIVDDDQPGVSVAEYPGTGVEDQGSIRYYFSRTGSTAAPLTVSFTLTGDATPGTDYTDVAREIVIPAGSSGIMLQLDLRNDTIAEGSEAVICTVVGVPGLYGVGMERCVQWIADDDLSSLTRVTFASAATTVPESAGTVQVVARLTAASTAEVRVDYSLGTGVAFHGVDYTAAGGTLVFAPGVTQLTIPVTILEDGFREPSESVELRLTRATGAQAGTITNHVLTITDNDTAPPPVAGFTVAASFAGEGSVTPPGALVFLSAPQTTSVSLSWAVTGGTASPDDAAALSGTLTFLPGETAKPVPLQIADDSQLEPSESFVITISNPVAPLTLATAVTHTITVADNDDTSVSIVSTDTAAAEQNSDAGVFSVTRTALDLTQPLTVQLSTGGTATPGADYAALPAELTIPAHESAITLTVTPMDDASVEPDETVVLSITPSALFSTGTPSSATITITDNETGIAVVATDALAGEPDDTGRFLITRSGTLSGELTVPLTAGGTATPGADYTPLPASAVFAAGQASVTVDVLPQDDTVAEAEETITLTAAPGAGYVVTAATAQALLRDDDTNAAPVAAIQSPVTSGVIIPPGPGLVLNATVSDDGRPAPAAPPVITWSSISGPGNVSFGNSGSARTTAQFSAPGHYLLRLTAADAELSTSADLGVLVLSDALTGSNIGHSSALTALSGGGGAWTLTGLGSSVSNTTSDSTYFAHRQMTGDFTLVTRVVSIGSSNTSARCGVMVRSGLGAGARHAFMSVTPNRLSFVYRPTDGGVATAVNSNQATPTPRYVRLRRAGHTFTAEHSVNGTSWTAQGNAQTVAMPDPVFVGLVATSASTTSTTAAVFENFSVTPAGNVGPLVHAGPPQSTGPTASLAGTITDDDTPAVRWEKHTGPGGVVLPGTASGPAHFDAPGAYVLRLFANDGEVETFADTTVQVTNPFAEWQALHFGANAGDPLIAGPRADPDFDGLENLAEFALTSDPVNPDANAAPLSSRTATALSMTWRESAAPGNVTIQPQWSADASAWSGDALSIETLSSGAGWIEKRATLDITVRPRVVLRLLVTLPAP